MIWVSFKETILEMTARVILFASWVLQQPWPQLACLIALPYVYIAYQRLHHHRQDQLFRVVSENAADLIALVEVTGKRLYNSPAYQKVLGYPASSRKAIWSPK
jgi:PAS domain-containing protein